MQSDGMTQYAIWTALEAEGLGANLQHYNPLIDQKVATEWKVPESWELSAQMVIGEPAGEFACFLLKGWGGRIATLMLTWSRTTGTEDVQGGRRQETGGVRCVSVPRCCNRLPAYRRRKNTVMDLAGCDDWSAKFAHVS